MATILGTKAAAGIQPKGLRVGTVCVATTYSMAASLSVGDVIQMIKVPAGATVVSLTLSSGSGQGVVKVGDGINTARYMTGYLNSVAAATSIITKLYTPYTYSTDDTIDILVSLVSTGVITGGFNMTVIMSMDA